MSEALEDWQISPNRTMVIRTFEPSGWKFVEVRQDGVALEWMFRRVLQNIASKHYGFDQVAVEAIQKSAGKISLGDPDDPKVNLLAEGLQSLDISGINEPLFTRDKWKIGQPEAMVCRYNENPQRLCSVVNAMIEKYGMQDTARHIIYSEMEHLENVQYQGRG